MTNTNEPQIVVEELVKRFGTFTAVDHVSFEIARGEIMGFLGPNGAGKSTLIRILCGLLHPTSGRATVAGIDVAVDPDAVRNRIGYMSQKFSLYNDLSVEENLEFFGGVYGVPHRDMKVRLAYAIEMAGLVGREHALVATLAGGWKQRLALGAAILHKPQVIFLDEPTSGVDPQSRRRFWDLIHDLSADGVSALVSTHYMDEAEYCHRIAMISAGRLIALGTPHDIKHSALSGALLLVDCSDAGRALEITSGVEGVVATAVFGRQLHVTVDDAQRRAPALQALLIAQGLTGVDVRPIEPTMEDSFVSLIEQSSRNKEATP